MRNIITFILLLIGSTAMAQKVKSKFLADSIIVPNTFIEISPVVVNAHGDTARSVYWIMGGFGRDLTPGFNLTTNFYDKNGAFLTYENKSILGAQLPNLILIKSKIDSLMRVTEPRIVTQ